MKNAKTSLNNMIVCEESTFYENEMRCSERVRRGLFSSSFYDRILWKKSLIFLRLAFIMLTSLCHNKSCLMKCPVDSLVCVLQQFMCIVANR